ncbi:MAG: SPOR domain-containing protein [Bacteroidetes bacterium]|nr:SPOR domain-containing protein [Bacteroidota bacterium]
MRRHYFFILYLLFIAGGACAQANSDSLAIVYSDPGIKAVLDKKLDANKRTNGKTSGFRIQIHFGSDRTVAKEKKTKFLQSYPDVATYEMYEQPNFKVRVGNFKNRLDAHKFLKQIKDNFPDAFIVEDKVEMTRGK